MPCCNMFAPVQHTQKNSCHNYEASCFLQLASETFSCSREWNILDMKASLIMIFQLALDLQAKWLTLIQLNRLQNWCHPVPHLTIRSSGSCKDPNRFSDGSSNQSPTMALGSWMADITPPTRHPPLLLPEPALRCSMCLIGKCVIHFVVWMYIVTLNM